MKDDADKYKPDVAKVLRDMEPAKVLARRQEALAKFYAGAEGAEAAAEGEPAEARVSAASPWAKDGAAEIDKAALPSVMAPTAQEPAAKKTVAVAQGSHSWRVVAACAALGATVVLVALLVEMGKAPQVKADATTARLGSTSERAGGPGVMMTAVTASATAAEPSATATASGAPTASAGAPPGTASARPKASGTVEDPYSDPPDAGARPKLRPEDF